MSREQPLRKTSNPPDPFFFVGFDSTSIGKRRSNSQSARSHAAKVTHRRKQEAQASATSKAQDKPTPRATYISPAQEYSAPSPEHQHLGFDLPIISLPEAPNSPSIPLQNPSPILGALANNTFHLTALQNVADPVQYCIKVIWPKYFWYNDLARTWLATYAQQPLYFHYIHYLTALHAGLMRNQLDSPLCSRTLLYHRGEIIRSLKEVLDKQPLVGTELEIAISFVCSLAILDFQQWDASHQTPLPFVPYLPSAEWLNVLGRLKPVEAHLRAVDLLINQAGGFYNLESHALQTQIAMNDLYQASINNVAPKMPNVWTVLSADTMSAISCSGAQGFPFVPGSLPSHFIAVLMDLNKLDKIMNAFIQGPLDQDEQTEIIRLRNATHHRLLSIAHWQDLALLDQQETYLATYECCRLTATLYSQSIVFPLPPDTGWHIRVLQKLEAVLQTSSPENWTLDVSELLTWVLMIAGIASYRTSYRAFFERSLRNVIVRKGWHSGSWPEVRKVLDDYLWSDEACNRGAAVLWDALNLEKPGDRLRPTHELSRRITG